MVGRVMPDSDTAAATLIPPLFMFGFERSGTTLLSMMVGAHPSFAVPLSVTGLWYQYERRLGDFNHLKTRKDLELLVTHLLGEERIRLWDVRLQPDDVLDGLATSSFPEVVRKFHNLYAKEKCKPYWANLDIATLDGMDTANRWFPDARFIHIVRDGRDVALSHETMPYGVANMAECAEHWVHRLTVNMKMGAILGEQRYLAIRYEDLILETVATLEKICAFIGASFSRDMLAYQEMVREKVPDDKRWLWPALDKPPDASKVYAWKNKMSRAKLLVFEDTAGDMLKRLNYEALDSVPPSVGRYLLEFWCFLGRGGRMKRIARKFGVNRVSSLERRARRGRQK
jgi:hypothetical protein